MYLTVYTVCTLVMYLTVYTVCTLVMYLTVYTVCTLVMYLTVYTVCTLVMYLTVPLSVLPVLGEEMVTGPLRHSTLPLSPCSLLPVLHLPLTSKRNGESLSLINY